jgi:hypothetical protein
VPSGTSFLIHQRIAQDQKCIFHPKPKGETWKWVGIIFVLGMNGVVIIMLHHKALLLKINDNLFKNPVRD